MTEAQIAQLIAAHFPPEWIPYLQWALSHWDVARPALTLAAVAYLLLEISALAALARWLRA